MGRLPIDEKDKKKQRQVYLTDGEKDAILKKHKTLTDAIKTTIKTKAITTTIPKK